MNRRTAKNAFPANELGDPSKLSYSIEDRTYFKALKLNAFRGKIEILGNNDIYQLPSIKVGMHRA